MDSYSKLYHKAENFLKIVIKTENILLKISYEQDMYNLLEWGD
jgi:hypothetical protein